MAFLPLRQVPLPPDTASAYDGWLQRIGDQLADPACDRWELCRRVLTGIYYPHLAGADLDSLPEEARITLLQMDARNITLEPEYYSDIDPEKYARVKPLIWLWEMFDKSPLGENVHLGVKFRRILARHIFRRCGRNFKCFHFVKLSFGYNIEVGDGVVVHRHVLLDDRGGIVLGDKVSVADFANIYSHTHELGDQRDVHSPVTVLGDGARVTYHATILSGSSMQPDSMVGAMAVVTKDVESGVVAVGIPAQPRFSKPKVEERPVHPPTKDPLADPA
jgi:acetyltransferase-like isoleucine patch superfamily enzyme